MKKISYLTALGIITLSGIVYELLLTRIFSLIFSYHYVFVILSAAMLGSGMGALFLLYLRKRSAIYHSISSMSVMFSWSIIVSGIGLSMVDTVWNGATIGIPSFFMFLFALLPFFMLGILVCSFFQDDNRFSSLLYACDLFGAATGALLAIPLMNHITAGQLLFGLSLLPASAAILLSVSEDKKRHDAFINASFIIVTVIITGISGFAKFHPLNGSMDKDMNYVLSQLGPKARVTDSQWSAFGKTELVSDPGIPTMKYLFIDGAAGTRMYNYYAVQHDTALRNHLRNDLGEVFPLRFMMPSEKDSALVIGAGGGRDVVEALLGGVGHITAVEVNPGVTYFMNKYADFNGGLYFDNPRVSYIQSDARRFVNKTPVKYNLIYLDMPVTKSSRGLEGLLLTENYLFTLQAFQSYLKKLKPDGRIIIVTHGRPEMYRAVFTAVKALTISGESEISAMKHIYAVAPSMMPVIVIKKTAFTPDEARVMHRGLHKMNFDRGSYFMPFVKQENIPVMSVKGITSHPMFDPVLTSLSTGERSLNDLIKYAPYRLDPVTDNSPFYYNFTRGIPAFMKWLLSLLTISVIGFTIWLYRKQKKNSKSHRKISVMPLAYVSVLSGMGFMITEVILTEQLSLLFEQPTYSLAVVLFALLTGAAIGSWLSHILKWPMRKIGIVSSLMTSVLLAGWMYFYSMPQFAGLMYVASTVIYILIIGITIGIPFPVMLRMAGFSGHEKQVYYLWGLNGFAAVLGSVLSMALGIVFGFTASLTISLFCYLLIAVFIKKVRYANPKSPRRKIKVNHDAEKILSPV